MELILRTMVLAITLGAFVRADSVVPPAPPRVVSVVRADARTGRLVRSVVVSQKTARTAADPDVRALVEKSAKDHDVSPLLVDSVIQVESNYNAYAVSPKGAQGLMQLMPATARQFGVTNSFDAGQNIEAGVRYLKFLKEKFQDDRLAIAAYNAGEGAVAKYGNNVPPYTETVNYVAKVSKKYGQAKQAAEKNNHTEPKRAEQPKPVEEAFQHIVGHVDSEGRLHIETR